MKVTKLPRDNMKGMVDRIINVPLVDEDINKTVSILPRHPDESQLVAVQLKRRIEMKNSHIEGYIRPNVILKALQTLKDRGNKYYQDININNNFMEKQVLLEDELKNTQMDFETESQKNVTFKMMQRFGF